MDESIYALNAECYAMQDEIARLEFENAMLKAENAELRELCRDVFAHESIDCERCAYGERCRAQETTCYTAGIIIQKRARELGVDDV